MKLWVSWKRRLSQLKREPKTKHEIGRFGETQAAQYLKQKKGYRLICRNWKGGRDEIDLVVRDGNVLVFVEVRTRQADALVPGYDSITAHKKRVLCRVCKAYLKALKEPPKHFRFDIVEIRFYHAQKFDLSHYENVPLFSKYYHPK